MATRKSKRRAPNNASPKNSKRAWGHGHSNAAERPDKETIYAGSFG